MTQEQIETIISDIFFEKFEFNLEGCSKEIYKLHLQDKLEILKEIEKSRWSGKGSQYTLLNMVTEITKELKKL